ncbi:hypothetical protein F0U60_11640 [Archangium minus]|uniref:Peptidase S24/S26A/S26B/S26C domain-containing protein n=1 Tax=Archangium minus TaxID=83450 RepID=A0ABY9WN27_9BACT|nr:hypothetical protein F0U60_11640 [Archangium minus]
MRPAEVLRLLEALPEGRSLWLTGLGRSMVPLLWPGDGVRVLRCGEDALAAGDIALVLRRDGRLSAHVVARTGPLETRAFLGASDEVERVLGRVTAVKRGRLQLPVPRSARSPLLFSHRLLRWLWRHERVRGAWRAVKRGVRPLASARWVGQKRSP